MSDLKDLKSLLLSAPPTQLDANMHPLIEEWDEIPTSLQILEVLDHCIHSALASSFVIRFLQTTYDLALKREGKVHNQNIPFITWREHENI